MKLSSLILSEKTKIRMSPAAIEPGALSIKEMLDLKTDFIY